MNIIFNKLKGPGVIPGPLVSQKGDFLGSLLESLEGSLAGCHKLRRWGGVSPEVAPDVFHGVDPQKQVGMANLAIGIPTPVTGASNGIAGSFQGNAAAAVGLVRTAIDGHQVVTIDGVVAACAVDGTGNAAAPNRLIPQHDT